MHTVFALLCFVVVIHWLIFQYPSGLLHWHCGNLTIAPVPAKQPWWIWVTTSCEFIMNDCITTTKQSTTKPCAYFLGYTVAHNSNNEEFRYNGSIMPMCDEAQPPRLYVFRLDMSSTSLKNIHEKLLARERLHCIAEALEQNMTSLKKDLWKHPSCLSLYGERGDQATTEPERIEGHGGKSFPRVSS